MSPQISIRVSMFVAAAGLMCSPRFQPGQGRRRGWHRPAGAGGRRRRGSHDRNYHRTAIDHTASYDSQSNPAEHAAEHSAAAHFHQRAGDAGGRLGRRPRASSSSASAAALRMRKATRTARAISRSSWARRTTA